MVAATPSGWRTPSSGSWLARFFERSRRLEGEFDCAVRVVSGSVPGESGRWAYRRSAVDPHREGDVLTLNHGVLPRQTRLRLRLRDVPRPGDASVRPHHVIWTATELDTGAVVELAAPADVFAG